MKRSHDCGRTEDLSKCLTSVGGTPWQRTPRARLGTCTASRPRGLVSWPPHPISSPSNHSREPFLSHEPLHTSWGSTLAPHLPWSLLLLLLLLFVSLQKSYIFALVTCKTSTLRTRMLFYANPTSLAGSDVEKKRILCCLVKQKTCET